MNPFLATALVVTGVGLLAWHLIQRRGRHWWAREWALGTEMDISRWMAGMPGLGLAIVSGTILFLVEEIEPTGPLMLIALPFLLLAVVGLPLGLFVLGPIGVLSIKVPLWFLPKWSRESIRKRREAEKEDKQQRRAERRAGRSGVARLASPWVAIGACAAVVALVLVAWTDLRRGLVAFISGLLTEFNRLPGEIAMLVGFLVGCVLFGAAAWLYAEAPTRAAKRREKSDKVADR